MQDLRLGGCAITSTALSGAAQLTRLEIEGGSIIIEPGILSTKTRLQHLQLKYCSMIVGPAGVAQLLAEMQPLQQLTYLSLKHSFGGQQAMAPVELYSGVTASSKLQHLEVSECILPAGVWQHMLPAGKLLQGMPLGSEAASATALALEHACGFCTWVFQNSSCRWHFV